MPFNGSGAFSRVYNWVTDKNNSINITASRMDTEDTGFATGLSSCVLKDGTQTITADLPMSGFKLTGVGNASARNQNAVVGQIQDSTYNWIAGGGTADVITATYSPAVTALVDGMELDFRATAANATTTPTFSPNGVTAHTITMNGGNALSAGNIPGNLFEGKLRYNLANTRWELMNPSSGGGFTTGDIKLTIKTSADAGWVMCNDGTIGNGSSGGTTRANADTVALYTLLWTNVSDTYAPVSTGRGANAAADYAANKTITLTKMLGRSLALSGAGSGLTSRSLGQTVGEETHTPTLAEMFAHTHTATVTDPTHFHGVFGGSGSVTNDGSIQALTGPAVVSGTFDKASAVKAVATGVTVANATQGSSTAFNVMQPTSFLNAMIKL